MISLPHDMRDSLVEHLDEWFEAQSGAPDAEAVAAYVIELLGTAADELKVDDADEIVLKLETSGELDASLQELLEEELESNEELELTGEEIVSMIEKVCDIEWTSKDDEDEDYEDDEDEDDPDGFFDEVGGDDDDE